MLHIYCTQHKHNRRVSQAFAQGIGAPIVGVAPLQRGQVFMYGCLRGLLPTLLQAQQLGRTWWYADNGYFRRGHYDGYYRVTKNAFQHDGRGEGNSDRFDALDIPIQPWKKNGQHVVVCPPSRLWASLNRFDADAWLKNTIKVLKAHTDRNLVARVKMSWSDVKSSSVSLHVDLQNAWALVTHSSNAAVEALIAGIPVFCTDPCAAQCMGLTDITKIETPIYPDDRVRWASVLANNQWTLDEMSNGLCWEMLKEQECTEAA